MIRIMLLTTVCFGMGCPIAFGQYYDPNWGAPYGYGGYHASTAAEGYARGMADVIRAQGMKNLSDAQAANIAEDARTKYLNNRVLAAQKFWERREVYQQKMAEKHYELAEERQRHLERNRLKPLNEAEFDETTGDIHWPEMLMAPEYDKYRLPLEDLFHKWAEYGTLSSEDYLKATDVARDWRQLITSQRTKYTFDERRMALRFILRLTEELDRDLS